MVLFKQQFSSGLPGIKIHFGLRGFLQVFYSVYIIGNKAFLELFLLFSAACCGHICFGVTKAICGTQLSLTPFSIQ